MPKRVLVVDDSLFMRTLISDMLGSDPEIEVADTAKNGKEAISRIAKLRPDCVTLDLMMPGWDGLTTLKHIMSECPTPCVILSGHSREGADITIECLNAGAVGFVLKPSGELSLDIENVKHQLIEEVKAASKIDLEKIKKLTYKKPEKDGRKLAGVNKVIIIGASTGGLQTLESILPSLPADFLSPIIVAQHLPNVLFTESLAERLNGDCELTVKVAQRDEVIQSGKVYLAPGGSHMTLTLLPDRQAAFCIDEAKDDNLTPSIDLAMESVAKVSNANAVGIILSGMGHDGRRGMKAIKESGGKTIVQDESSLIFGMPKAVIEAGLADEILPAGRIADAIMEYVSHEQGTKYERDARLCLKI
jgi:two-component system chemotaxis response regulator CheB